MTERSSNEERHEEQESDFDEPSFDEPDFDEPTEEEAPSRATRATEDRWQLSSYIGWLISSVLILPVRGYQQFISPLFGPTCRFDPTCSEYFIQAVRKYGPVKGAWRGVCRIARCHPFHPGGHDPP